MLPHAIPHRMFLCKSQGCSVQVSHVQDKSVGIMTGKGNQLRKASVIVQIKRSVRGRYVASVIFELEIAIINTIGRALKAMHMLSVNEIFILPWYHQIINLEREIPTVKYKIINILIVSGLIRLFLFFLMWTKTGVSLRRCFHYGAY